MTKCYIVMGSTGEYSDRDEWPVAVYVDGLAAQDHVEEAEKWCRVAGVKDHRFAWEARDAALAAHAADPTLKALLGDGFSVDYTGVQFWLVESTLRG